MANTPNYIGFDTSAEGRTIFQTINPVTNQENPQPFAEATQDEVFRACEKAAVAFETYSGLSGVARAGFIEAIAQGLEGRQEQLLRLYSLESGLPQGRAQGELGRTTGQLRLFAQLIRNDEWRIVSNQKSDTNLKKVQIPLGPVAVFGASNFPFAFSTAGGDTASALAAGCPVVVKAHPLHAGTSALVAEVILQAARDTKMPDGVFSHLNSAGVEVGQLLVTHPAIKAVGFTGSLRGGRALYDLANQRKEPIPVFAEMGSINPVVITPAALATRGREIAEEYAGSITLGAGQFCTNPGLILAVDTADTEAFITYLADAAGKISPQCMLHPRIATNFHEKAEELATQDGVVFATKVTQDLTPNYSGALIATVSGAHFLKNSTLEDEVFGPFSLVVRCQDLSELQAIIRQLGGQLTASIIAEKEETTLSATLISLLQTRVGRIVYNGVPTGVAVEEGMTHGGPYPASTDSRFTAVGDHSIYRWVRPFSYQGVPEALLPDYLK